MDLSYYINCSPFKGKNGFVVFKGTVTVHLKRYDDKLMVRWSLIKIMLT